MASAAAAVWNAATRDCAADLAGLGRELGLDLLDARQQLPGPLHERAAGVGQLEPPAGLAEQLDAGLALELGELLRDRRRREGERLGRARDRALGGELAQHGQPSLDSASLNHYGAEKIACAETMRSGG